MHKHKITLSTGHVTYMPCYGGHDYKKPFSLALKVALVEFGVILAGGALWLWLANLALKSNGI